MDLSLSYVIPVFATLIVSLSVHEAAHAWAANRLGDPTARLLGRLTLNPMAHIDWIGTVLFPLVAIYSGAPLIGWAKPVPVSWANLRAPRRDFAIVALAGPLSNIALALVAAPAFMALLALTRGGVEVVPPLVLEIVLRFILMNAFLAVFNLIPVPPLDGGNVLAGLVPEPAARALDALRPYGIFILYALMFLGVLRAIASPVEQFILGWLL